MQRDFLFGIEPASLNSWHRCRSFATICTICIRNFGAMFVKIGLFIINKKDKVLKGKIPTNPNRSVTPNEHLFISRRKAQNLSLESDSISLTSGQRPTSITSPNKRPPINNDEYTMYNGPTKKRRISHFRKDFVNHDTNNRPQINSSSNISDMEMLNYKRNLNTRSREYDDISMRSSGYAG